MRLKLDSGRSVDFDSQRFPHLDHGYAVTSYSSQGQTAERVLIHVDTELGAKDARVRHGLLRGLLRSNRRLPTRRIGGRVLIPVADLRKYARGDHPERIMG
jgi:hypothetical protein